jgi:hypothetical protein
MRTGPKIWVPSVDIVNPIDGQVLIDSGILPGGGCWLFHVIGYTDAAFKFSLLAVSANKFLAKRFPAAGDVDALIGNQQPFIDSERVRVLCIGGATANLHLVLHGLQLE